MKYIQSLRASYYLILKGSLMTNQGISLKKHGVSSCDAKLRIKENGGMMVSRKYSHTHEQFNNNSSFIHLHLSGGGGSEPPLCSENNNHISN